MTTRPRRALTLEIEESDGNSIAGRLSDGAGQSTEFSGWLGLAAALETAVRTPDGDVETEHIDGATPVEGPSGEDSQ